MKKTMVFLSVWLYLSLSQAQNRSVLVDEMYEHFTANYQILAQQKYRYIYLETGIHYFSMKREFELSLGDEDSLHRLQMEYVTLRKDISENTERFHFGNDQAIETPVRAQYFSANDVRKSRHVNLDELVEWFNFSVKDCGFSLDSENLIVRGNKSNEGRGEVEIAIPFAYAQIYTEPFSLRSMNRLLPLTYILDIYFYSKMDSKNSEDVGLMSLEITFQPDTNSLVVGPYQEFILTGSRRNAGWAFWLEGKANSVLCSYGYRP